MEIPEYRALATKTAFADGEFTVTLASVGKETIKLIFGQAQADSFVAGFLESSHPEERPVE